MKSLNENEEKLIAKVKKMIMLITTFSILLIVVALVMYVGSNGWQLHIDFQNIARTKLTLSIFGTASLFFIVGLFMLFTAIRLKIQLNRTDSQG